MRGSRVAESPVDFAGDPLNLMRVMPPKGGPSRTCGRSRTGISAMRLQPRITRMNTDRTRYNSRKIYVAGEIHPDIRVPFREIDLAPTKTMTGEIEINEPVRVYDTSGPWGDSEIRGGVEQGLPALRAKWIRDRDDVEEIVGRAVRPIDDGYLSETHAAHAKSKRRTPNAERPTSHS